MYVHIYSYDRTSGGTHERLRIQKVTEVRARTGRGWRYMCTTYGSATHTRMAIVWCIRTCVANARREAIQENHNEGMAHSA